MPEKVQNSTGWGDKLMDKLPELLHFTLALVLCVGIFITYVMLKQVPEVLAFTLTSVVGYFFGRSNKARGS